MNKLYQVILLFALYSPLFSGEDLTTISPEKFICPERFSVLSKYIFTKFYDKKINTRFHSDLYRDVLKVLSPGFREGNSTIKTSYDAYIKEFKNIIQSIKTKQFDADQSIIPYKFLENSDPYFIDGEHRIGASLYFNTPLVCKIVENHPINSYDSILLQQKKTDPKYLDYMAIQYARLKPTTRIILLFSRAASNPNKALSLLKRFGKIVYQKTISITAHGAKNLVKMLYDNDPNTSNQFWLLEVNHVQGKASGIMDGSEIGNFIVILWEGKDDATNRLCKQQIREAYPPFSHHTIHISDGPKDTMYVSHVLFNQNSIDFLNMANPKHFDNFLTCAKCFRQFLEKNPDLEDSYIIDTGAVLSALGIRDCQDCDVICDTSHIEKFQQIFNGKIDIHNKERLQYGYNLQDLIYNPDNYFYYKGIKFISIKNLIEYKLKRKSEKDLRDVRLLKAKMREGNAFSKS